MRGLCWIVCSAVAADVEVSAAAVRVTQEQVMQAAQRTNELVHLISTATRQQTTATAHVTHTMQAIAAVSDATSHAAGALDAVIGELLRAAERLNSAVAPTLHPQPQPQPL